MLTCLLFPWPCYAGAHPARLEANSDCLQCHADHATGNYVHAAVKLGCDSCHSVKNRENATYVVLKPSKLVSCFECHQAVNFAYSHLPYASGMCNRCHNSHVSAVPHLLRAKVNDLCLGCHLRTAESSSSQYMPTIALMDENRIGHPDAGHPVSGARDPLTGAEMSCVSCHTAHGGGKLHHLKMASEIPEDALNQNPETKDMCRQCHLRMWGLEGASDKKKKKHKPH